MSDDWGNSLTVNDKTPGLKQHEAIALQRLLLVVRRYENPCSRVGHAVKMLP